ncbi:MAG: sigma-70 family RNA polymerase sigma factor [Micrococcales bacterium]|nr:sigma-70 family RNA polymerase sigma factor [Micrococcales bacterium]
MAAAAGADVRVTLQRALATLAPRQRALLVLRYYEDLPESQVADVLGISVSTVKTSTRKALARLRESAPGLVEPAGGAR